MYVIAVLVVIVVYYLINYLKWRKNIYNYLEKIPGDVKLPIIGTTYRFLSRANEDMIHLIPELIGKYGSIFRAWIGDMPQVELSSPEYLEIIMKNSDHINKGSAYNYILPWLGEGLLTSGGAKWHQHRKLLTPTFHFKILEEFMDVFVEKTNTLLSILESKASDRKTFNIYTHVNHCALDIICETAMGVTVNAMLDEDNKYVKAVYDTSEIVSWRIRRPFINDFIFNLMGKGKEVKENLKILHGFTERVIVERKEKLKNKPKVERKEEEEVFGKKKRTSFLNLLLEVAHDNATFTDKDIREEVDTFMFEGHDTTTAAICWTIFLLGNNPDVQEKVYEEVHSVLQDKSTPTTLAELHELKYLERVIKEALRMYPIVPIITRRLNQDITIGSYKIPAGIEIALHIYGMQRSEKYYPNPNKFNPDRFLPENSVNRHPYAFVPFSAGPRNCIGQKFAMFEEKTMLSSIINRYKIKSMESQEEMKVTIDLVLKPMNGIEVQIEKRK